jgi:transposase
VHRHELTDLEWRRIQPFLPSGGRRRPSRLGDRSFVNAVLWVAKTGVPWRDLPERFGPWKTVFNRFSEWSKRGVWRKVFKSLRVDTGGDVHASIVDASIVRAHQDASGGKGGSKPMLSVVLEVGSPRKSTSSSTPTSVRSTSSSPPASGTRPPSRRGSSLRPKATPSSPTPLTTPRRSVSPSPLEP